MSLATRFFRFLARMPLSWMQHLGAVLGWLVWGLSPTYRRHFKANVAAAGVAWHEARAAVAATEERPLRTVEVGAARFGMRHW